MASIFTFDHEPPRVNSPWQTAQESKGRPHAERAMSTGGIDENGRLSDSGSDLDRLAAEPQDGPIEYKLHLLLRPRRAYKSMSTTMRPSGSQQSRQVRDVKSAKHPSQPLASSNQTRQHRLEHLTTQLLWRLQQSSPYHTTARGDLVIPKLPTDSTADLSLLKKPQKLLPGLEESNGALYELGVADDGTFVGLTKEEMDESMTTLKIMAASLGCRVDVQRMKAVGTCEWFDEDDGLRTTQSIRADLWVAEARISPILNYHNGKSDELENQGSGTPRKGISTADQLRVAFTGPTTSGKTSLLGTLSNGTLDNGRGSSRINLLKHSHEVASGRTSSVAQELIGYEGNNIYNYAVDNVNIWPDIHDRAENGRLVFFLDSAGHPRYQRTTLRALVGWAPHWTLLCIAANQSESVSSGGHSLTDPSPVTADVGYMDLAMAHLDLCLKLEIPLAILITKYDIVQKARLKEMLGAVFTKVKASTRSPKLMISSGAEAENLSEVSSQDLQKINDEFLDPLSKSKDLLSVVPVILTSAVKGTGIGLTHALLRSLPVPTAPTSQDFTHGYLNPEQPAALFHIDEVYELPMSRAQSIPANGSSGNAPVLTGYLRFGKLSIGDKVVVGPFPAEDDDNQALIPKDHPSPGYGLSIPHPLSAEYARLNSRATARTSAAEGEWQMATIVNIRNLRLPVRAIEAGQAASLQISLDEQVDTETTDHDSIFEKSKPTGPRIRKGQVLALPSEHMLATGVTLQAATGFTASFKSPDVGSLTVGSMVNVYIGMIRAAARVLRVTQLKNVKGVWGTGLGVDDGDDGDDDVFGMSDNLELGHSRSETDLADYCTAYRISLELLTTKEWIELGSRVVLVEGSNRDKSGLDGHVGVVDEVTE